MAAHTCYGVDFSGAATAGRTIWVTSAHADAGTLRVRDCARADDFLAAHYDGPPTTDRAPTLAALVSFIRSHPDAVFGLDFPFAVPRAIATDALGATTHRAVVAAVAAHDDGDDFAATCVEWATANADGATYLRRATDREHDALSPYHFFVAHQTYHGIASVLAPLDGAARIVPFDPPAAGGPVVAETYPAGVLDARGLPRTEYKGTEQAHTQRRARILDGLADQSSVVVPDAIRATYRDDTGGDALDSLLAALGVSGCRDAWGHEPSSLTGHIYV